MGSLIFWSWLIGLAAFILSFIFVMNRSDRVALLLCGIGSGLWVLPIYAFLIRIEEIRKGIVHIDAFKFEMGLGVLIGHLLFGLSVLVIVVIVALVRYYKSQRRGI